MSHSLDPPAAIDWLIAHGRTLLQSTGEVQQARWKRDLAAWQCELLRRQIGYRWRSRHRFPQPDLWLWTDTSLAQASDHWSAQFKAGLFPAGEFVVDACCGAGADLVALAGRGDVLGIDADPALAALAQDNARTHGLDVAVHVARLSDQLPSPWASNTSWLSIDPDRRPDGQRTTDAQAFSPALDQVLHMSRQCRGSVIKLAPSTRTDEQLTAALDATCSRMWLGSQGECRQLLLLSGELRYLDPRQLALHSDGQRPQISTDHVGQVTPLRSAVLCEPGDAAQGFAGINHVYQAEVSKCADLLPSQMDIGRYVYDLHPTLHAADLQRVWSSEHGLRPISEAHGYYSSDALVQSPWAQAFEQIAVLAWDDRKIRQWLRGFGAGQVEVKVRGVHPIKLHIDANACQKRYSRADGEPIALLVTRIGDRLRGIAARRSPTRER